MHLRSYSTSSLFETKTSRLSWGFKYLQIDTESLAWLTICRNKGAISFKCCPILKPQVSSPRYNASCFQGEPSQAAANVSADSADTLNVPAEEQSWTVQRRDSVLSLCAKFVLSKSLLLIARVLSCVRIPLVDLTTLGLLICPGLSKFVTPWSLLFVWFWPCWSDVS